MRLKEIKGHVLSGLLVFVLLTAIFSTMQNVFHIESHVIYAVVGYLLYPIFKYLDDRIIKCA